MRLLRPATARQLALASTLLRVVIGTIFLAHGGQKLFVYGLDGVAAAFSTMGIPFPALSGAAIAFVEFGGGLALVLGLFTRVAALGLALDMLGALLLVHGPAGFFLPNGYEFVLALLVAVVTLAITGAGAYSLDARLATRFTAPIPSTAQPARPLARAA